MVKQNRNYNALESIYSVTDRFQFRLVPMFTYLRVVVRRMHFGTKSDRACKESDALMAVAIAANIQQAFGGSITAYRPIAFEQC